MKTCGRCGIEKGMADFYVRHWGNGKTGLKSICIPCAKAKAMEWYKANTQRHRNKAKKWWSENKQRHGKSVKKWTNSNLSKVNQLHAKRRAAKKNAVPTWANEFFIGEIYDLARLRTKYLGVEHHVDHIVPLVSPLVCGLHVEHNLQVIPGRHNESKGNKTWPNMPT